MSLKVPYLAQLPFMETIRLTLLQGCVLRAYKNDLTPNNLTVLGDFVQADFNGYALITVNSWGAVALNADNKAQTTATPQTWTLTNGLVPNTVYGIYVTTPGGVLLYAERNPLGGILLDTEGQSYSYTPRFTVRSEF